MIRFYESLPKQDFYGQLEHDTRSRGGQLEIQGHAEAQSEGVQYRSEEKLDTLAGDRSSWACDVQSFGETLRVRTSHGAEEEAIPA